MSKGVEKLKTVLHLLFSNKVGGAEKLAIEISSDLKNKYDFKYMSQEGPIKNIVHEAKIPFFSFSPYHVLEFRKKIQEISPDLIHAHDFKATVFAKIFSRDIPVISHIHQNPEWQKYPNFKSKIFNFFGSRCNKVIYVSKEAKGAFFYSHNLKNSVAIKNAVNRHKIEVLANMGDKSTFDILFVGRIESIKNPLRFVEIVGDLVKTIPNIKAGIVGDGSQTNLVKKKIAYLNIERNIKILGFQRDPYGLMRSSKIVLSTSRSEAFGLTIVEAAMLGTPPMAPNLQGISEITKEVGGKLYNSNAEAESEIIRLISNSDYYNTVKRQIDNTDFMDFDEESYLKKISVIYDEVLRSNEL